MSWGRSHSGVLCVRMGDVEEGQEGTVRILRVSTSPFKHDKSSAVPCRPDHPSNGSFFPSSSLPTSSWVNASFMKGYTAQLDAISTVCPSRRRLHLACKPTKCRRPRRATRRIPSAARAILDGHFLCHPETTSPLRCHHHS